MNQGLRNWPGGADDAKTRPAQGRVESQDYLRFEAVGRASQLHEGSGLTLGSDEPFLELLKLLWRDAHPVKMPAPRVSAKQKATRGGSTPRAQRW